MSIVVTKYYLYAWLCGLASLLSLHLGMTFFFLLNLIFCFYYSWEDSKFDVECNKLPENPHDGGDGPTAA